MTMLFIIFLILVAFKDLTAPVDGVMTLATQMLASFTGTISVYALVYRLAEKKTEKRSFLSFIGLYTLEIYVLHFRFARLLGLSEKGLQLYSPEGILWVLLAFTVMSILTAVSIIILQRIPIVSLLLFGKRKSGRSA